MTYYETRFRKIEGIISASNIDKLREPDFLSNLFKEEFKVSPIVLNTTPKSSATSQYFRSIYVGRTDDDIPSKGIFDVYSFKYEIESGYELLNEIYSELRIVNSDFDIPVVLLIDDKYIGFKYDNFCSKSEDEVNKSAKKIFENVDAELQSIVSQINEYSNFYRFASKYVMQRLKNK